MNKDYQKRLVELANELQEFIKEYHNPDSRYITDDEMKLLAKLMHLIGYIQALDHE